MEQENKDGPDTSWESAVARDVLVGTTVGEYQVVRRVGMGGMGFVYEALQPLIGRRVALKILRPHIAGDPSQVERLLAEARVVSSIHHRAIIDVYGFGQLPNVGHYMVMEFLSGHPLERELATRPLLPIPEVWDILDQTLSGLEAAHEARVIHRDLKPSNIFLVEETGGPRYVKLLDFGLAKRTEKVGDAVAQTQQSLISGTPAYMAPEQAQGKPVTVRSDLYAVGCIAFEMLTRHLPFEGGGAIEVAYRQVHEPAPSLRSFRPTLPESVEDFVQKFLHKDPEARYASAAEARAELLRVFRELETAAPISGELLDPVGAVLTSAPRSFPATHFSDRGPALTPGKTGISDTIRHEPVVSLSDTAAGISASRRVRTYLAAVFIVLGAVAGGYFAARTPPVDAPPDLVSLTGSQDVAPPTPAKPPPDPAASPASIPAVTPAPAPALVLVVGEAGVPPEAPANPVVSAVARAPERPSAEDELERGRKALGDQLRALRDDYLAANPNSPADDPVLLAIAEERKLVQQLRSTSELSATRERVKKFDREVRRFDR